MAARSSKLRVAIVALIAAVFSCAKPEIDFEPLAAPAPGDVQLEASIFGKDTKTSLFGLKVNWGKDDVIGVFISSDGCPSGFSLESGAGSSSAVFSGYLGGEPAIAKYPYRAEDRYQDGYISTDLPEKQEYVPGSFASGISPMAALPDANGKLSFRNLCSVIRITLTGKVKITELVLTTMDEECYLAGPAKIRLSDNLPYLGIEPLTTKSIAHTEGDGYTSVRIPCEGAQLSPVIQSVFCFVIPSQVYESGLLLEVRTELGAFTTQTGKLDLKSSTLYDMEPIEVKINGDVDPSPYLPGQGTQASPYLVSSLADLLHIQNAMASKGYITNEDGQNGKKAQTAWYLMTEDIDLSPCCGPGVGNWKPLTVVGNTFTGHFDGGGHKISGLYVNASDGDASFFGDVYTNGYLGNLEVEGDVTAEESSIVCGSVCGTVENCIARGIAVAHNFSSAGGVANSNFGTMLNCVNYASTKIDGELYHPVGGVAATAISAVFSNCTNYGNVYSDTGNCKAGGICGRNQQSTIYNCTNYGEITGKRYAGGITGEMFQTEIINCVNYGKVTGSDNTLTWCAGICGELGDPVSNKQGSISNCVNLGEVSGGKYNAGICSNNSLTVQRCYWLYDTGAGIKTGVIGGTDTGNVSLTKNQMAGNASCSGLYGNYSDLVDALNAYAFDTSTQDTKLQGWMYDSKLGGPCLTGRAALPPGEQDHFIKASPTTYTLNTLAQTIELTVTSSAAVSLTMPDWITTKSTQHEMSGIFHYYTFTFNVQQNKTGSARNGSIGITGEDGTNASVAVTQRYTYISDDYSRNGNVVTVQKASEGNGIDIVLMGDAYTDSDIKGGKYESDMKRGIDAFFSVEPYASFRNLFNIYYVEVVSQSSETGSTAFSTYFGNGTLVGGDAGKVRSYCNTVTKKSNLDDVTAIVIINTARYAGTCWMYYCSTGNHGLGFTISYFPLGTTTTGTTSMEALIRHEAAGHGFGKLADEYSYQSQGKIPDSEITSHRSRQEFGWWPNIDFTDDPFSVRWSKYIQDNRYAAEQINVYEGGATYWTGVWRPTLNSIMRYNTGQFNAPSREAIYYKIHRLAYGSGWAYDHETFVAYDAVNRSATAVASCALAPAEMFSFRPTHPPVLVTGE